MPELPEVETIRRELEREAVGKRIKSVEVHGTRTVRRQTKKAFIAKLDGHEDHRRRPAGASTCWSARLRRRAGRPPAHERPAAAGRGQGRRWPSTPTWSSPSPRAASCASSTPHLRRDVRHLARRPHAEVPELAELGLRPGRATRSRGRRSASCCGDRQMKLKAFLTDQTIIAGIGNIYSDEILFAAGLRYDRMTDSLSTQEIRRLYRSVVETLHDAIKYGGSTLADEQYVDLERQAGRVPGAPQGLRPREAALLPLPPGHHLQGQVRRPLDLLLRVCQVWWKPGGRPADPLLVAHRPAVGVPTGVDPPVRRRGCVPEDPDPQGVQVVRRRHHARARAGRHRGGRPQRQRQVQRGRRHRLGARRPGAQRGALPEDGRRHLRRHRQAQPRSAGPR